ncbi:MAG: outer membrane lipoprotein chaperone LolA [Pseudomonadota bacterium]|nr:outer membrane lipoprotein chaperone LolA [Pseudomonadota bacterium]
MLVQAFQGVLRCAVVGVFACVAPFAIAQQAVSQEEGAVRALENILMQTRTLSTEVDQLFMDQDGRELQETRALLLMEKPAKFRWEVMEPYEELTVTDGETLWLYQSDLEQVTIQPFDGDADRVPIMLLNGDAETIREAYDVSSTNMGGDLVRFVLIPRNPDRLFERLSVTFKGLVLDEMQFEDSLGQQTSMTFRDVNRNVPLEPAMFTFTPPAGIDVIDNRE